MSEVFTNNASTATQYKPSSSNHKDTSAGFAEAKVGGAMSYQIGTGEQGMSEMLGGMKLSDALKESGKVRIGPDLEGIESIGSLSYTPNSEEALGFSAVSATGFQHTQPSDIKADSVLRISGVQAQAEQLFKAGIISKNEKGHYVISGQEGGSTTGKK